MKRILWIVILIAVLAAGAYFVFGMNKKSQTEAAIQSKAVTPTRGDLRVAINSTGKVQPVKTVDVKSKASGEVTRLYFEEGDYVRSGDLLLTIDQQLVKYEFDKANADLEVGKVSLRTTEREFDRQKELFAKQMISESDMDAAQLKVEQAKAALVRAEAAVSDAKKRLDDTVVRSPISGLIIKCDVEQGNIIASGTSNVSGGTLLMQIAQVDSVYIVAQVDETDIGKVELGQKVEVEADAFEDKTFHGEVLKIAPMARVEQNVTVFEVTTKVDNGERKLKAGMNAAIEIITAFAENALLVPNAAIKDPRKMGMTGEMMGGGGQGGGGEQRGQGRPGGGGPPSGGQQAQMGTGNPQAAARFGEKFQDAERPGRDTKIVMIVANGQSTPKRVVVGASNLDFTQILDGLTETDSVDATPFSQMMADREEWRNRMNRFSTIPGMTRPPGGGGGGGGRR